MRPPLFLLPRWLPALLVWAAVACPALAAEIELDSPPDRWGARSEFWRQVRQGLEGSVNQRDRGVLIRAQGREWRSVHDGLVPEYGKQLVVITAAAIAALLLFSARGRTVAVRLARGIARLGRIDRLAYWLTAASFLVLGTTGLVILYGRHMLVPLLGHHAFARLAEVAKYLHDRVSWAFMLGVVLLVLVWIRDHVPGRGAEPLFRPLAATEKLIFWSLVFGGIVVSYSGLALLFPLAFAEAQRMPLMQIVHSLSSLTLASLIFGHVFIAAMSIRENARKLAEAKEELERRVEDRTRELEAAKTMAEEANRTKDRFLAAAGHDLLQPLSAARLMVATLRQRSRGAETRELIDTVQAALSGAEDMLSDLLDMARLGGGRATRIESVTASDLLRAMRAEFLPVARKAGLELRVVDCRLVVRTDAHLLNRVLRNLLSNAVRYTRRGRILLGCRRVGAALRLEVWDTGIGIAPAGLERIFLEFHREEQAAGLHRRGTGLGLAIVRRIAQMLDHPLTVRSRPGRGSVFAVTVPLAAEAPVAAAPTVAAVAAESDLAGLKVLAVDNDREVLLALAALLKSWGCRVAACGSRASALAGAEAPEVIVADYHLDDGLGVGLIGELREKWGPVPALVVTADRSEAVGEMVAAAGLDMLAKPIKPAKLRALLAHLVSRAPSPAPPPESGSARRASAGATTRATSPSIP